MIEMDNMNETEDTSESQRFYGKYRGTVFNNIDPEQRGRIMAIVPDVSGIIPTSWAEACVPVAGSTPTQMGMFAVPPIGAGGWIEFEQGDPDYPIWTGCFFGSAADVPMMALAAPPGLPPIVLQSIAQNKIIISSTPGDGIRLETALGPAGPSIIISPTMITISDGKGALIALAGGAVSINLGALIVK